MCAMQNTVFSGMHKTKENIPQKGHWENYSLGWTVAHEAARNLNLPNDFNEYELCTNTGWTVAHECAIAGAFSSLDKYKAVEDGFGIRVADVNNVSGIINKDKSFIDHYYKTNIVIDLLNTNDLFGLELLYEDIVNLRILSNKFVFIKNFNIVEYLDDNSHDFITSIIHNIYNSGFIDSNLKKYILKSKFNEKFTLHILSRYINTNTLNVHNMNIKYINSLSKDIDCIYDNYNFYIYKFFANYIFSLIFKELFKYEYNEYIVFHCNSASCDFIEFINFTNFEKYILECTTRYNNKSKYANFKKIKILPLIKQSELEKEFNKSKVLILCIDFISFFSEFNHLQYLISGNHFKYVHVVCLSFDVSKFTKLINLNNSSFRNCCE